MQKTVAEIQIDSDQTLLEKTRLINVPVARIKVDSGWRRRDLNSDGLASMTQSLAVLGQLQPIGVRKAGGEWKLVFGQVRLLAAQKLGWDTLLANEYPEMDSSALLDLAIWAGENLHRNSLAIDEIALVVHSLAVAGMSGEVIARVLSKEVGWVECMLSIAREPLARQLIEMGRLVDVEAWPIFMQLAPQARKMLLDSMDPITSLRCALVKKHFLQNAKKKPRSIGF